MGLCPVFGDEEYRSCQHYLSHVVQKFVEQKISTLLGFIDHIVQYGDVKGGTSG